MIKIQVIINNKVLAAQKKAIKLYYHSFFQVGVYWKAQEYDQSLSVLKNTDCMYSKDGYLKTIQALTKEKKRSFLWFDASSDDMKTLQAQLPEHHVNPLYRAIHQAYDIRRCTKQLMINRMQSAEFSITEDQRLCLPLERPCLSVSAIIQEACTAFGLAETSWEHIHTEWQNIEDNDDAFTIDGYLNGDHRDLDVPSQTLKGLGLTVTLQAFIDHLKEIWVSRLEKLYTEPCGLLYLTDCVVSKILQSCETRHQVFTYDQILPYLSEQIRRAPHRGDQRLMSGQNSCSLSILTFNPSQSTTLNDLSKPEYIPLLRFGGSQREVQLFLLDATPIQLQIQFGLDERYDFTLNPAQLSSACFDEPLTLTTLYDEEFVVLLKQNSSYVIAKRCS